MTNEVRQAFPVRLQTHVWNPAGRRRALLLHGLGSDGTSWWRIASELARADWMVVAPDLRGHGRSPSADDHSFEALTADAALLGIEWDLVVGHSLGGTIAACLLDPTQPQHRPTRAAVLIDPVLHIPDELHVPMRDVIREDCGTVSATDLRSRHPRWHERDIQRKVLAANLLTPDVVDGVFEDNRPWDVTAVVGRIRMSVTVLIPEVADIQLASALEQTRTAAPSRQPTGYISPRAHQALEANPAIAIVSVADAGHSIHRDAPEVVLRAIDVTLGAHDNAGTS